MFEDKTDDEMARLSEKIMFVVVGVVSFVLMAWKDYEMNFWIFGTVDPWFLIFIGNIFFYFMYYATADRLGRTSYLFVAQNMHTAIIDQRPEPLEVPPMLTGRDRHKIYETFLVWYPGTSWPQLSRKRSCIIVASSLVDEWGWCIISKGALKRYAGTEQLNLPYDVTTRLQKFASRWLRFRFTRTEIWFAEHPDSWVARPASEYKDKLGPIGDEYEAPNGKTYKWLVGGEMAQPYNLAAEEGLNRRMHTLMAAVEHLEGVYQQISGEKFEADK